MREKMLWQNIEVSRLNGLEAKKKKMALIDCATPSLDSLKTIKVDTKSLSRLVWPYSH